MINTTMKSIRNKTGKIICMVRLSYKVTSTRESLARNSHASHEYMQGYVPVEGLQGLKLVQDFN